MSPNVRQNGSSSKYTKFERNINSNNYNDHYPSRREQQLDTNEGVVVGRKTTRQPHPPPPRGRIRWIERVVVLAIVIFAFAVFLHGNKIVILFESEKDNEEYDHPRMMSSFSLEEEMLRDVMAENDHKFEMLMDEGEGHREEADRSPSSNSTHNTSDAAFNIFL